MRIRRVRWSVLGLMVVVVTLLQTMTVLAAKTQLGESEKAWWSDTTIARWKKVDKAKQYQVRLYDGGDELIVRKTVDSTYIDLTSYMKEGYDYYFEVRAVVTSSQKNYTSGNWVASDFKTVENIGDTTGRWRSYQEGKKYYKEDGTYVTNEWYQIVGKWYYFDADSYMQIGWQNIGNEWYYLGTDGIMQTGWKEIDGAWYHLKENGVMSVGWVQGQPNQWYYLNSEGKMVTNTIIDGHEINDQGLANR